MDANKLNPIWDYEQSEDEDSRVIKIFEFLLEKENIDEQTEIPKQ